MGRKKKTQETQPATPGRSPTSSQVTEEPQTADPPIPMAGNQSDMLVQLFRDMEMARREERLEEKRRFDTLIAAFTAQQQHQIQQQEVHAGNSQITVMNPQVTPQTSLPKVTVQPPPMLSQDVTLRQFKEWKQLWDDYVIMVDLHSLPQPKQLVQLR